MKGYVIKILSIAPIFVAMFAFYMIVWASGQ